MRSEKKNTGYYILLWFVAIFFFLPVLWIVLSAFKTREDILAWPPKFFFTPTMQNFVDLFNRPIFVKALINSIVISLSSISIAVVVAFLASYAFSRL